MKGFKWLITVLLTSVLLYQVAFAQDAGNKGAEVNKDTTTTKNWEFSLAPVYLWAASTEGEMTVRGIEVDVEESFSDIIENFDGGIISHFEGVYKQKFGFFADLVLIKLNPKDDQTAIGNIRIDYKEVLAELGGFYRYTTGDHTLDGMVGMRYSYIEGELNLPDPLPDVKEDVNWIDPFFGLRWWFKVAERWHLRLRGDVGGFGAGSDLAWNLIGLIDYQPWKYVALGAGYRVYYQDYSKGKNERGREIFAIDSTMHGPILGLDIRW